MYDNSATDEREISLAERINSLEKFQYKFARSWMVGSGVCIVCLVITVGILSSQQIFMQDEIEMPATLTGGYKAGYTSGEKIPTFASWNVGNGDLLHINVEESPEVTPQKLADIKDTLYSNVTAIINSHTYYKGWENALKSIQTEEKYAIPTDFHTIETSNEAGNIIIHLTDIKNGDGYNGITKSNFDSIHHEILKSDITIYGVDKLNDDEFRAILRHELGHAFGLRHLNDPNDLMHATVNMDNPYISPCDIQDIEALYDGHDYAEGCN